jgi:hypothetical protein
MCLEMMPSWCRQVNWGNCGIPWVNCAVLCMKDDWKGQFWGLRYWACQNCTVYSVFPSGMTSHSNIAHFNWECIATYTISWQTKLSCISEIFHLLVLLKSTSFPNLTVLLSSRKITKPNLLCPSCVSHLIFWDKNYLTIWNFLILPSGVSTVSL